MAAKPAIKFDVKKGGGFTLDVPEGVLNQERVSKFFDYLVLDQAREESELTPEQVDELAREVDLAVWEQVRKSYEEA